MTTLRSRIRSSLPAAALFAAVLSAPSIAGAQASLAEQTQSLEGVGPSRFISTNPFLPLFGYFSGEYEQRIKPNVAFAISGSHIELDDRFTHLDAKLRLYPNDRALEGFSLGASLGIAWIRRNDDNAFCDAIPGIDCVPQTSKTFSTPSFAIEGGYQWLLGKSRSTAITVGFGAKRYLSGSRDDFRDIPRVLPTGRLSIGYGF